MFMAVRVGDGPGRNAYSLFGAGVMLGLGALAYLMVGLVIGRLVPPSALLGGSGGGQVVLLVLSLASVPWVAAPGGRSRACVAAPDRRRPTGPAAAPPARLPFAPFAALSWLVVALQIAVTLLSAPHRARDAVL